MSWPFVLLALGFMVAGVLLFEWLQTLALKNLRRSRDLGDQLFGQFRALTEGIKELQLHQGRRRRFLEQGLIPDRRLIPRQHRGNARRRRTRQRL
ncbi:MAG: hypothetical protein ACRERU_09515 [Methylococcales bacterium]